MNRKMLLLIAYVVDLFSSLILAMYGFWYIIFIPAIAIGIIFAGREFKASIAGLFGAIGVFLSLVVYQPAYRISEASLLAGIIGIPLGPVIVILILLLISFLLAFLGTEIGCTTRNWSGEKV
jgi:hypothetical protein